MDYFVGKLPDVILADRFGERRTLVVSRWFRQSPSPSARRSPRYLCCSSRRRRSHSGRPSTASRGSPPSLKYTSDKDGSIIGGTMATGEASNVVMPAIAVVVAVA